MCKIGRRWCGTSAVTVAIVDVRTCRCMCCCLANGCLTQTYQLHANVRHCLLLLLHLLRLAAATTAVTVMSVENPATCSFSLLSLSSCSLNISVEMNNQLKVVLVVVVVLESGRDRERKILEFDEHSIIHINYKFAFTIFTWTTSIAGGSAVADDINNYNVIVFVGVVVVVFVVVGVVVYLVAAIVTFLTFGHVNVLLAVVNLILTQTLTLALGIRIDKGWNPVWRWCWPWQSS